jgi:hypothetical protein
VDLNSVYEDYMLSSMKAEEVVIKGHSFELTHMRLKPTSKTVPTGSASWWFGVGRYRMQREVRVDAGSRIVGVAVIRNDGLLPA